MRLVTCVGSKSSGKTCLLNILQEQVHDGKAFSIQEQDSVFSLWQEFDHKPNGISTKINDEKSINSKRKKFSFELLKASNKVVPEKSDIILDSDRVSTQNNSSNITSLGVHNPINSKVYNCSELLGKTAPTIGVNHFEFIVDDLTLQVAGKYWKHKECEKQKSHTVLQPYFCTSKVDSDRIDGIELRELGGEIGKSISGFYDLLTNLFTKLKIHRLACLKVSII